MQKDRASPEFFFKGAGIYAARGKKEAELPVIKEVADATLLFILVGKFTIQ